MLCIYLCSCDVYSRVSVKSVRTVEARTRRGFFLYSTYESVPVQLHVCLMKLIDDRVLLSFVTLKY